MIKQSLSMIFIRNKLSFPTETIQYSSQVRMSQDLKIAKAYVSLGGKNAEKISRY